MMTNQNASLLILVDIDGIIELFELVLFAPVLCILELAICFAGDKLASTQVPPAGVSRCASRWTFISHSMVSSS